MNFIDGTLTAILVIAALYYLIKHFAASGSGCCSCTGCRKGTNGCDFPGEKRL